MIIQGLPKYQPCSKINLTIVQSLTNFVKKNHEITTQEQLLVKA